MLISCNKLKSHIKNSETIDFLNIWNTFTIRTAEVEDVKVVGNSFDNVVVAEILTCEEHPDSDHMHILSVDCGEKEPIQVVCGAPNVRVGLKTAYVKVGGHIDGMEIKARPLRGGLSNGMCCSGRELGISDDHNGIMDLPQEWVNGKDIKEYLPIDDIIVEIDNKSLTNRPDLWGHYGIAREICAITEHELLPLEIEEIVNDKEDLDIVINNPELCYRYCGLKLENIKNNKTPLAMQIFLYYVGMRSISLLVDVTNYLMLELGQPMHAFDARVVKNIEVGLAKAGDKYTTLDGTERTLTDEMLMIKNGDKYFGIAGVMGGLDSEILSDTTSTFIESATFNAGSIRRCAVKLGLRTEASARYEKSLDPNMTDLAIKRLVYLLRQENPEMIIASNLTDIYPSPVTEENIVLDKKTLSIYMGRELADSQVKTILETLGFKIEVKEQEYVVTVPTYRATKDIKIKEDLIEEIARIYGLENFEPKPLKLDLIPTVHENIFDQEYQAKKLLATKFDMNEVHSYLWYDTNTLKELGIEKDNVKLIGKESNNILRDDMSFSLMNIVRENFKNYANFKIFEIGTIIQNNQNQRVLSIILTDEEKKLESIYNKAKEVVKYLFKVLKHKEVVFNNNVNEKGYYDEVLGKIIMVDDTRIGEINVLNKACTNKLCKKKCIVTVDIDFDKFVNIAKKDILAQEVSKYPTVTLDYTVVIGNKKYQDLVEILNNFRSNLIKKFELLGVYENKYTVRYGLGSDNKTLDQKDLQMFKDRFIAHINSNELVI
ncbi:MAG: phenylalanine--tRNA ligase subunit beta, partial [Bacilli bacterium]|nr:phenylalanine--tRNA ligase subunit beta [Bacilli bacterium]